jgi:peptidoglycan hydrolase-like protein with peptidoglycan-binding domain
MKTLLPLLVGAVVVGASVPAFAGKPIGAMHPEESIPDNLPRMTSPGPYDDFIKQVQQKLHQAGFDAGPVNGDFGEKTQAALAQFQIANLLPASGALDDETLRALGVQRASPSVEASPTSDGGAPSDGSNAATGSSN